MLTTLLVLPAPQLGPSAVVQKLLLAGVCFHCYQQVSYMILQRVSPVTHRCAAKHAVELVRLKFNQL